MVVGICPGGLLIVRMGGPIIGEGGITGDCYGRSRLVRILFASFTSELDSEFSPSRLRLSAVTSATAPLALSVITAVIHATSKNIVGSWA